MDDALDRAHADRLRAVDPLVVVEEVPPDAEPIASGPGVAAWARVSDVDPAASWAVFTALRRYELRVRWAGDEAALDGVLTRFAAWAHERGAGDAGDDSQASISWPARDLAAARVFVRHGLLPGTTIAVRRRGTPSPPAAEGAVRLATPADAEAVARLQVEEVDYERALPSLRVRPGFEATSAAENRDRIARGDAWCWVAEVDGEIRGVLSALRPEEAAYVIGPTAAPPSAYVALLSVTAAARGRGLGARLAATAHAELDAAGIAATYLHHGTFNPLSTPFWYRRGYRPLTRDWETTPAHHLR